MEWLYRKLLPDGIKRSANWLFDLHARCHRQAVGMVDRLIVFISNHHKPEGVLARSWPTGQIVAWVGVMLAVYLLLSFWL